LASVDHARHDLRLRLQPPDAQAGREDLRERPHADHAHAAGAQFTQRGQVVPLEAQQAVGVVLEHDGTPVRGELDQVLTTLQRKRRPGRVLERRDRVDELRRLALRVRRVGERLDVHAVLVAGDLHHPALVARDRGRAVGVRGRLDGDEIARLDEELADEIEALHGAGGDQELVRVHRGPLRGEEVHQRAAERRVALGRPIVERGRSLGGQIAEERGERRARDRLRGGASHRHPHDVVRLALEQAGAGVDHRSGDPVDARGVEAGQAVGRHLRQCPGGARGRPATEWCNIDGARAPDCWAG
jgi:hypothetical protein